ncbi:DNA-binding protein [Bacillus sp. K2I17]|nr:DNA-binding protein [Bacillus sp. K2I17]
MNKKELTKVVAEKAELTQKNAAATTQTVLDTITNNLADKEKV